MRKSVTMVRRISLLLVTLVFLLQVATVAAAGNPNPGIAPINSSTYGKTYGEWSEAWWNWISRLDGSTNPFTSTTCLKAQQSEKVIFLAGTEGGDGGTRTCTVSPGTPLLVPILNFIEGDLLENIHPGNDAAAFLQQLNDATKNVALSAAIDGVSVKNLTSYNSTSPFSYNYVLRNDNLLGAPVGTYEVVSGGYYILLHPLAPGKHTIELSGASLDSQGNVGFSVHVKYLLTVA